MNSDNNVIPSTQRKDGTWRKEVKIRPGYVNIEEMPRYVVPRRREEEDLKKAIKQSKARYEGVPVGVDPDEWRQMKDAEDKKKQKKRIRKKKDGHGKEDNEEHGGEEEDDNEREQVRDVPESWEDEEKKETVVTTKEKEKGKESKKVEEKEDDDGGEGEDPQKQARKLKKKLRQIELLEQKHAEGKELNTDEMAKITGKKDLVALLESLKI